ncbi:uncharacterized protein BX664DRAFT_324190 [Halteromyces radiatus]|uniref:uncharacterized protein n=1 Tax=Halteromyces radiatus TaxID=101107 RepID=UPI00221F15C7|nr:uncharacterized protein BX664DRAFT_324190 [Halteromyces radiatus]KAI8096526.1 hypothetical protein BX664DRAFT_324190 [Halteromyces radiatus]
MGLSSTLVNIDLENDHLIMHGTANESLGCVLRGVLHLHLKQSTKIKSILLRFTGSIRTSWTQPLGHGHERFFQDERTVVSHQWIFLAPQYTKTYSLQAGTHSYEFELPLAGHLPESVKVAQFYNVQYQLKATIQRPHVLPNYACHRIIHLTRQRYTIAPLVEPISVMNQWTNKVDYDISLPTKLYHHGDTIRVAIRLTPLMQGLLIRQITCTFKEYATCKPVNGWFGGRSRSHGKILYYTRNNLINDNHTSPLCIQLTIPVPDTVEEIQCDTQSDQVRVRHKLKFVLSIENPGGHLSELRAVVPVTIQVKASDLLPSYEQAYDGHSFPYDPTLMVMLLRRHHQQQDQHQHQEQQQSSSFHYRRHQHHRLSCSMVHDIQQQRGTESQDRRLSFPPPSSSSSSNNRSSSSILPYDDPPITLSRLPTYDEVRCH